MTNFAHELRHELAATRRHLTDTAVRGFWPFVGTLIAMFATAVMVVTLAIAALVTVVYVTATLWRAHPAIPVAVVVVLVAFLVAAHRSHARIIAELRKQHRS